MSKYFKEYNFFDISKEKSTPPLYKSYTYKSLSNAFSKL